MKPKSLLSWGSPLVVAMGLSAQPVFADAFIDALSSGKTSGNINLRYETVKQDNPLDDAKALTVRTRLTYATGSVSGFSGLLEFEDSRPVGGFDDYSVPQTGFKTGQYSVIADPQTTELDQAFIQYKNDWVTAKGGRQVIALDGQRFVGHVGWRQDRQTFDALTADFAPIKDLSIKAGYITQRNRIFAEVLDQDSKDKLLNVSYKTPVGTVAGYAYLLELDNGTNNALDTIGVSFNGAAGSDSLKFLYGVEFASQDAEIGATDYSADYMMLEVGAQFKPVTVKLGMEVLGSDNSAYGFATPLATLHKFNGWADTFLTTPTVGLVDTYLSMGGKLGPVGLTFVYHNFEADDDTPTVSDLGDEIDLQAVMTFAKNYTVGLKVALYDAGDISVDTDKIWLWTEIKF